MTDSAADRGTLAISIMPSGIKLIFNISLQAGINNVSAIVCGFFAFMVSSSTLELASFLDLFPSSCR
jgi:hypothetical protein